MPQKYFHLQRLQKDLARDIVTSISKPGKYFCELSAVKGIIAKYTQSIEHQIKVEENSIMITFYNQTNIVDVNVAKMTDEFAVADYEKFNKSLCQYLDSIELAMYR